MSRQSDVFIPAKMCFKIDGTRDNVDEHFDRLRTKNLNVKVGFHLNLSEILRSLKKG